MEDNDALTVIKKVYDALFQAQLALENKAIYKRELENAKETINKFNQELKKANENKRLNDILLFGYKQHSNIIIEICEDCNGCGGFDWQDENGGGSEPCQTCKELGYFIKEKVKE
jgi:type II secretory pathway component PulJ